MTHDAQTHAAEPRSSRLATLALVLSILGFVPPFGISGIVLGHISSRQIAGSRGALNGRASARAAIVIGYLQLLVTACAFLFAWQVLHVTLQDFRRDFLVQHVLEENRSNATLDYKRAYQEELNATNVISVVAFIENKYHRDKGQGYLCSFPHLHRYMRSLPDNADPLGEDLGNTYFYELRCDSDDEVTATHYTLTAVPSSVLMPEHSLIYCLDQGGVMRQIHAGTSLDCFEHGTRSEGLSTDAP